MTSSFIENVTDVSVALGKGIYSVGEDIYLGVQRTSEIFHFNDRSKEILGETRSLLNLLEKTFNSVYYNESNPLYQCIEMILKNYYDKLPDSALEFLARKAKLQAAYTAGRMLIGAKLAKVVAFNILTSIISSKVFKILAKKLSVSVVVSATGVGAGVSVLMLQGLLQRSSHASLRLNAQCPRIYEELRRQDLHLLYFLIEDAMKPYIKACQFADQNPQYFHDIVNKQYDIYKKIFKSLQ